MRELELIAALEAALGPPPDRVVRSLGDDAAVVRAGGPLAVTSVDAMVDGVHFRLGEVSWADAGHRALALHVFTDGDAHAKQHPAAQRTHSSLAYGLHDTVRGESAGEKLTYFTDDNKLLIDGTLQKQVRTHLKKKKT